MMSWLDRPGRSTAGVTVNCSPVPVPLAVAVRLLTEDAGTPRLLARVEEFTLVALPSTRADTIALWNAGQHTNAKPCTYVHCKPSPHDETIIALYPPALVVPAAHAAAVHITAPSTAAHAGRWQQGRAACAVHVHRHSSAVAHATCVHTVRGATHTNAVRDP
jgi:hypothetical protein